VWSEEKPNLSQKEEGGEKEGRERGSLPENRKYPEKTFPSRKKKGLHKLNCLRGGREEAEERTLLL